MSVSHVFIVDYENSCHDFVAHTSVPADCGVLVVVVVPRAFDVQRAKLHPTVMLQDTPSGVRIARSYSDKPQSCDNTLNQVAYALVKACNADDFGPYNTVNLLHVDPRIQALCTDVMTLMASLRMGPNTIALAHKMQLHIVAGSDKRYASMVEDLQGVNATFHHPRFTAIDVVDGSSRSLAQYLMAQPQYETQACGYFTTCRAVFRSAHEWAGHIGQEHPRCRLCSSIFLNTSQYDAHRHNERCSVCNTSMCSASETSHMATHVECDHCDDLFKTQAELTQHLLFVEMVSTEFPEACRIGGCRYRARLKSELGLHRQKEHPETCYSCVACGHASPSIESVKRHRSKCKIRYANL